MIWFLEGQSSQREVIMGARDALPASVKIIASHRQQRSEITGQADVALQEPVDNEERIDWVLETARSLGVKTIVAGRIGGVYEAQRARFVAEGLDLVTGGTSLQTFLDFDDKSRFTAAAEAAGLACIPAITACNTEELQAAYDTLSVSGEVCIKPVVGIYGRGFWRFKTDVDDFSLFSPTLMRAKRRFRRTLMPIVRPTSARRCCSCLTCPATSVQWTWSASTARRSRLSGGARWV